MIPYFSGASRVGKAELVVDWIQSFRKDDDWGCVTVRDFPPMSPFKLAPFYNRLQRMNQTEFPVTVEYEHKKPFLWKNVLHGIKRYDTNSVYDSVMDYLSHFIYNGI